MPRWKLSMYYFVTPQKKVIDKVGITPDYYVSNYANVDTAALTAQYETFAPMKEAKKPKAGETGLNVYGAQQRLLLCWLLANSKRDNGSKHRCRRQNPSKSSRVSTLTAPSITRR